MSLTASEQYLIELINRARLDPATEALRLGIDLNADLSPGEIDATPKQVLAPNLQLETAATAHSQWMLAADIFSHYETDGSSPGSRATDAGYVWQMVGENIAFQGTTGKINLNTMIIDENDGLMRSAHHRLNLLDGDFREIGVSQEAGGFTTGGVTYNSSMVTEEFGLSGSDIFITGVAYSDRNKDAFYSIGEGTAGISFAVSDHTAVTAAAGGYAVAADSEADSVLVTGKVGRTVFSATVLTEHENVKLDVVNANSFATSASITLGGGINSARLLGIADVDATGNALANTLTGNNGNNHLDGLAGNDTLFGGAGADTIYGGLGNDSLYGGTGEDQLFTGAGNNHAYGGDGADSVWGDQGNDSLYGDSGADILDGGAGNDLIYGGNGDDQIFTGIGNDKAYGGDGADSVWGDLGNDTIYGDSGADQLDGGAGNDLIYGGIGDDQIFTGIGNDKAYGGDGSDHILGDLGNDSLYGDAGADSLDGGAGNDMLYGGAGADELSGGMGNDVLYGGADADVFVFTQLGGKDTISDFSQTQGDVIALDSGLWDHAEKSASDVVAQYAHLVQGTVIFDFGSDQTLKLTSVRSLAGLADHIELF